MEEDLNLEPLRVREAIINAIKSCDAIYHMCLSLLTLDWSTLKTKLTHCFANSGTIPLEFNRK